MDTKNRDAEKVLRLLCASVLIAILTAGLWPFHAPKNQVEWLSDGLHFGKYGVILSPEPLRVAGLEPGTSCSVEIWLQPDIVDIGGTILAFYAPGNRNVPLSVHQSLGDLLLRRETVRPRGAKAKWYIENAFHKNKQLFVAISSNRQGTAVYLNDALVRMSPRFGLSSKDLSGQLVVGSHPVAGDGWRGRLKGLAIFTRELSAGEVLHDYEAWITNQPAEIKNEGPVALYLFDEGKGTLVHNRMNPSTDLHIPERYSVLHKAFLQPPWDDFDPSWGYCQNVLINIGGFIPLGFLFCAYFASVRRLNRALLATVVLGGVVSLAIEVLQGFLPTRDSGTTDIITNTLGTGIGAMLYSCDSVQAVLATVGFGGRHCPKRADQG